MRVPQLTLAGEGNANPTPGDEAQVCGHDVSAIMPKMQRAHSVRTLHHLDRPEVPETARRLSDRFSI